MSDATTRDAVAFLSRAPYENVYLQWLIESARESPGRIVLAVAERGEICGVAHDASNVALAGDEESIDAFANALARSRSVPRMIVAPRALVERYWKRLRHKLPQPWAIRTSQPLYALDAASLHAPSAKVAGVARATLGEAGEIVLGAARMAAGELGGEADEIDAGYRARIEGIIASGGFWRYRIDGRLVFQCYVGPRTAATAQLQGIWAPPNERGAGYATRGLGGVCRELLAEYPTLSLYVNDFNRAAIALYERLGFRLVGEFASVIF